MASRAVSISTGAQTPDLRSAAQVAKPSAPGSITSSTIASYAWARAIQSACSPSGATSVAFPFSVKPRRTSAAILGSSSTTSTFIRTGCLVRCERKVKARTAAASHLFHHALLRWPRMSGLHPTRRRYDMRARLTKLAAALAALTALAVGGSAIASAGSKANPPAPPALTQTQQDVTSSADGDTVQQGDQSAPDTGQASEASTEQASEASASEG